MLGYSIYDKSINGIKTISDGKILISNGNINNCNSVNADIIDTNTHSCNELSLSKNNITIDTEEFLTLNNIDKTKTIQQQFNNIDIEYNNLESQIENNTANITTIQGNIITINNINNQQTGNITQLQNWRTTDSANITQLQNWRTTDSANITILQGNITNLQSNVATIQSNYISNLVVGNVLTNTLSAGNNANVVLSVSTPSTNTRALNLTFNIPQGNIGPIGESFIWKGQWDNNSGSTYYFKNDVAYYGGASWICLGNKDDRTLGTNRDINPSDNPDEWQLMANKGDRGERGNTGDSGLDSFLTALGLAGLIGGSALAILAGVLSISQNATDLQNGIDNLDQDLDNSNQRIAQLENKTQNQTASVGTTRFKNTLKIENSLTLQDTITIDANNEVITCYTIIGNEINSNNNINCSNNITCANNVNTINLNASGEINLGTSAVSSININSLNTNINGFLTINGVPYVPYIPTNFFAQW